MDYIIRENNGLFGCLDENERWILVAEYDKIEISYDCAICWKNEKIQVYNLETKEFVLKNGCEDIRKDKDGYWAFKCEGKWGVFSTHGYDSGVIISSYDDVKQLSGGIYSVHERDGYGKDKFWIANSPDGFQRYIDAHPIFYNNKRILARQGTKYGFINSYNCTTIPFIYDEIIKRNGEDNFDVRIGNAWGILSLDGRELVQVKYKRKCFDNNHSDYYNYYTSYEIDYFPDRVEATLRYSQSDEYIWKDNYNRVRDARSGCMGVINRNGEEIVPTIYEFINIILIGSMPKSWKGLLPDYYPANFLKSDIFLFEPAITEFSTCDHGTWRSFGLYDIKGNIIVPVAYEGLSYEVNGLIFASRGQCDIYKINGDGKCLISNIDRTYVDRKNKRIYLFGVKEREYQEDEVIDIMDYCVPVDYDLNTILKNKKGEHLQLSSNTDLTNISEDYKIVLGGIEQKLDRYTHDTDYSSVIYGNSIVFKKNGRQGICYLNNQIYSPLYDELYAQLENDLFIVRTNNRSGLLYKGEEILRPIYYGISSVDNGFCFVIKESYSLYDIDIVSINDIIGSHITAFHNLTKIDLDELIKGNYLYFRVIENNVYFNNRCPFPFTEEFGKFISEDRISMREFDQVVSWRWKVI